MDFGGETVEKCAGKKRREGSHAGFDESDALPMRSGVV